jgi:uncharacterized protein YgiM (DUF1202 family)
VFVLPREREKGFGKTEAFNGLIYIVMKKNIWLVSLVMLSGGLSARQVTNAPPAPAIAAPAETATNTSTTTTTVAAPETNAPAAKTEKKKSTQKKKSATPRKSAAAELKTVPLVAGQATVIASNVNVRGQAKLKSEVITQVQKGQTVNVLEEVTLKNSGPSEPSAWAKIILPANVHVWVNANYISTNHTVIPKNLSLRGGAGENYSRLGTIKRGDEVKELNRKGDWIEIEAPAEASGYIAAQYLKQEATPAPIAANESPLTNTTVAENPPVTPASPEPPATTPSEPAASNTVANATPPTPPAETNVVEEPPPPRIVEREGLVRGTFSIQAPTKFELVSPDTGKVINYLYTSSPSLDLRRYKGMRIVVVGEEGLDERWQNTPVITIQKIVVLE